MIGPSVMGHADDALDIVVYGDSGAPESALQFIAAETLVDEVEQAKYARQRISVAY